MSIIRRALSTSSARAKIYELRTYSVQPKHVPEFVALTNKHIHLRTNHSKLWFYGATELGGQNEVVHIWEYDHYSHRQMVRAALAADEEWQDTYFSHIRGWMSSQYNVIMKEAYGFPFGGDEALAAKSAADAPPRVFELRRYKIVPGKSDEWWQTMSAALPARSHYNKPLGIWRASLGVLPTFYALYRYDTLDSRDTLRHKANGDAVWSKAQRVAAPFVIEAESKIIMPLPFSPLK